MTSAAADSILSRFTIYVYPNESVAAAFVDDDEDEDDGV